MTEGEIEFRRKIVDRSIGKDGKVKKKPANGDAYLVSEEELQYRQFLKNKWTDWTSI